MTEILPLGTVIEPLGPIHHYVPRSGELKAVFIIGKDEVLVPARWILDNNERKSTVLTVTAILVVLALFAAVASAMGHAPLWVSVILLCVVGLLGVLPLR